MAPVGGGGGGGDDRLSSPVVVAAVVKEALSSGGEGETAGAIAAPLHSSSWSPLQPSVEERLGVIMKKV